jgi:hypothetical protein
VQVNPTEYPQLRLLVWNRPNCAVLDGAEALHLYEAYWRFVDEDTLTDQERALIARLTNEHDNSVFMAN